MPEFNLKFVELQSLGYLHPTMGSMRLAITYHPVELKSWLIYRFFLGISFWQKLMNNMPNIYEHSSLKVITQGKKERKNKAGPMKGHIHFYIRVLWAVVTATIFGDHE